MPRVSAFCALRYDLGHVGSLSDVVAPPYDVIDDATITTRVKTSLLNDPDVGGMRIDVDTFKGVVTLSGRVKTREEEAKAVALARKISGVTEVKSTLQIQP